MDEGQIKRSSPWRIEGAIAILRAALKMQSASTYTKIVRIPVSKLGKNATNPPIVIECGITHALKFTLNTDKAYFKQAIETDYADGDITIHFHWTKSTTNSDQSGKCVKWQLKYLVLNGTDENCNAGEATDSIEDTYVADWRYNNSKRIICPA